MVRSLSKADPGLAAGCDGFAGVMNSFRESGRIRLLGLDRRPGSRNWRVDRQTCRPVHERIADVIVLRTRRSATTHAGKWLGAAWDAAAGTESWRKEAEPDQRASYPVLVADLRPWNSL